MRAEKIYNELLDFNNLLSQLLKLTGSELFRAQISDIVGNKIGMELINKLESSIKKLITTVIIKKDVYKPIYQNVAPVELDNDARNNFKTFYHDTEYTDFKDFRKQLQIEYKDSYIYTSADILFNLKTKEIEVQGYAFLDSAKRKAPITGYIPKISDYKDFATKKTPELPNSQKNRDDEVCPY